jgi:hypothetical protein
MSVGSECEPSESENLGPGLSYNLSFCDDDELDAYYATHKVEDDELEQAAGSSTLTIRACRWLHCQFGDRVARWKGKMLVNACSNTKSTILAWLFRKYRVTKEEAYALRLPVVAAAPVGVEPMWWLWARFVPNVDPGRVAARLRIFDEERRKRDLENEIKKHGKVCRPVYVGEDRVDLDEIRGRIENARVDIVSDASSELTTEDFHMWFYAMLRLIDTCEFAKARWLWNAFPAQWGKVIEEIRGRRDISKELIGAGAVNTADTGRKIRAVLKPNGKDGTIADPVVESERCLLHGLRYALLESTTDTILWLEIAWAPIIRPEWLQREIWPVLFACELGMVERAKWLMERYGHDPCVLAAIDGQAFIRACLEANLETVKWMWATAEPHLAAVPRIREEGAMIVALCVANGHEDMAQWLVDVVGVDKTWVHDGTRPFYHSVVRTGFRLDRCIRVANLLGLHRREDQLVAHHRPLHHPPPR